MVQEEPTPPPNPKGPPGNGGRPDESNRGRGRGRGSRGRGAIPGQERSERGGRGGGRGGRGGGGGSREEFPPTTVECVGDFFTQSQDEWVFKSTNQKIALCDSNAYNEKKRACWKGK